MVVQISIPVSNVADLLAAGYTHIEVWQSTDGGNLYSEVTAPAETPATLQSAVASTTYRVGGRMLGFQLNGGPEALVTFNPLVDYWTPAQVASRINEVAVSAASVAPDFKSLFVTSPTTGRASSVTITYNDAHELGFSAGQSVVGLAQRFALSPGTLIYTFTDVAGRSEDRYKWRFSNPETGLKSEFSTRIFGNSPPVDPNLVSIATGHFLGLDGRPKKTTVLVGPTGVQNIGGFVSGIDGPLVVTTDNNGFLNVPLLRGAHVRVAIEGTSFIRELVVPDTASFDLLSAMEAAPDPFSIQSPPPFLIRRSL